MSTQENWYARAGAAPHYQGQIADEGTGKTIAITYDDKDGENAQLIAAAPDMLKALEGCLRVAKAHYLDMVDQYTDDDPNIEEHLRYAHPNIAAAAMEVKRIETIIYKATGDV